MRSVDFKCPYCGAEFRDSYEYEMDDDDVIDEECYECGGAFNVIMHVNIEYEVLKGGDNE